VGRLLPVLSLSTILANHLSAFPFTQPPPSLQPFQLSFTLLDPGKSWIRWSQARSLHGRRLGVKAIRVEVVIKAQSWSVKCLFPLMTL
jgi:hypothetical protein